MRKGTNDQRATIILGLSNITQTVAKEKLKKDALLIKTVLEYSHKDTDESIIEFIGRLGLDSEIDFLEKVLLYKQLSLTGRAFYSYAVQLYKTVSLPNTMVLDRIVTNFAKFSREESATILSAMEWLCKLKNKSLTRRILEFTKPFIYDKDYLDTSEHLYSTRNPGWAIVNILTIHGEEEDLVELNLLSKWNVASSKVLQTRVRIKKEGISAEVIQTTEADFDNGKHAFLDLIEISQSSELFYLFCKLLAEQENLDYKIRNLESNLRKIVKKDHIAYLESKNVDSLILDKLRKLESQKFIDKADFINDLSKLLGREVVDFQGEIKFNTFLDYLYKEQKLSFAMKLEDEKDVYEFLNSIKNQLAQNELNLEFAFSEETDCYTLYLYFKQESLKFRIDGDDRFVLIDPVFYLYKINRLLESNGSKKRLVQLPPYETHILTLAMPNLIESIVDKYN